jgi:hypothetical protein
MTTVRVAGAEFTLGADKVERRLAKADPEPIHLHYAVVNGRRFPPKQVLALITGLDRADFTTHQARSILRRLGFGVYRRQGEVAGSGSSVSGEAGTVLDAFAGRWVAQVGDDVLYDADAPEAVVAWLRRHGRAGRVWRVPASPVDAGSALSTP